MFVITKKSKTPNILWDASSNCPLCKFVGGICKTEDASLAKKLKDRGYEVEKVEEKDDKKEEKK